MSDEALRKLLANAVPDQLVVESGPLVECDPTELWRGLLQTGLEHLQQVAELVATVTAKLDALGRSDAQVVRLRTIPGVGPRTAEVIVTVLDQPQRFATRRQVAAYGALRGLCPRAPGFLTPTGEHRWVRRRNGRCLRRTVRESKARLYEQVENEVIRMGHSQSAFAPWDDRRVERREQPNPKNASWS